MKLKPKETIVIHEKDEIIKYENQNLSAFFELEVQDSNLDQFIKLVEMYIKEYFDNVAGVSF